MNHQKRNLETFVNIQRSLHDHIFSYQSILDLCVTEIPSITFFGVSQEKMVNVCPGLEDGFAKSKDRAWNKE